MMYCFTGIAVYKTNVQPTLECIITGTYILHTENGIHSGKFTPDSGTAYFLLAACYFGSSTT